MKRRLIKIIATIVLGSLLVTSCKKKDKTDTNNDTTTGILKATVDGTSWVSASPEARIESGRIAISGTGANGSQITFSLAGESTGTYTFEMGGLSSGVYRLSGDPTSYLSNLDATVGGSITISKIDPSTKKMSGTFSFKAKHTTNSSVVNITEGSFEDLVYATGSSSGGGSNSMAVKIDGAAFSPNIIAGTTSFSKISLVGTRGTKSIGLTFPDDITSGNYTIGGIVADYRGQYNIDAMTVLPTKSGSLVITSHNTSTKRVVGTFSFEAESVDGTQSATITEGSFSIKY